LEDIDLEEVKGDALEWIWKQRHEAKYSYEGFHMGLLGCLRAFEVLFEAKVLDPSKSLIVMSEFGEELLGNRQNICRLFTELVTRLCKKEVDELSVVPSELTLRVHLTDKRGQKDEGIACSYCGQIHPWKDTAAKEGPGEMIRYHSKGAGDNFHPNCAYWKA